MGTRTVEDATCYHTRCYSLDDSEESIPATPLFVAYNLSVAPNGMVTLMMLLILVSEVEVGFCERWRNDHDSVLHRKE